MKNIVFIMADELRNDITLHEYYPFVKTPHLDRLRDEGVTFTNAFCQTPTCCPSRGSAMTGKYPQQLGLYNHSCLLPDNEKTIGHHFTENGYNSVAFGKTHHMNPGFQSFTYDMDETMGWDNHGYNVEEENAVGIFTRRREEYCDFVACNQFDSYLDAGPNPGRSPFLAFIGIYSFHLFFYSPAEYASMYDWKNIELPPEFEEESETKPAVHGIPRNRWNHLTEETRRKIIATELGMVSLVDDCVGEIVSTLTRHEILDETIVVFTSDHGDQMGEHGMLGKFYNTYEGSLRVPLIIRPPRGKDDSSACQAGSRRDQLAEMVDIYPTLCDLTGIPDPQPPWNLSGNTLAPLLSTKHQHHKSAIFSMIEHAHMVRTERWKLVLFDNDRSELYDLARDPVERHNLYGDPEHAETQLELTTEIVEHLIRFRPANHNPGRNTFFG